MKFSLEKIFPKKITKEETSAILPFNVRYALQYKKSIFGKEEIESLAKNGFEKEAMYLMLKELRKYPIQQKELLEKYINQIINNIDNNQNNKEELVELVTKSMIGINDIAVEAGKLAQISRQGEKIWEERFEESAVLLSKDNRNVFLIAHAILLGLEEFIKSFYKEKKQLGILVPSWIESENEISGYIVTFKERKVNIDWLKEGNFYKNNAVLVDDTKNTGRIFDKMKKFWSKDGSNNPDTLAITIGHYEG